MDSLQKVPAFTSLVGCALLGACSVSSPSDASTGGEGGSDPTETSDAMGGSGADEVHEDPEETGVGGTSSSLGGAHSASGGMPAVAPPGQVPGLVAVGYGGLRVVSRDGGLTWGDAATFSLDGGDDEDLLRAVTWGNGLWIATGWKLVTSTDGVEWVDHGLLSENDTMPCNIVEGLAFHDGYYFAACTPWNSPGTVFRSSDALAWEKYGEIGATEGHLFLTHRGGKFTAYGDSQTSYESTDGATWTEMASVEEVTFCEGVHQSRADCFEASWFDGTYLRSAWKGKIQRSETGADFEDVYVDATDNSLYRSRAIAAGYVSP